MNDIIKKATLKFFHYNNIDEFSNHLAKFLNYYNCQKKLKSLKFKSPYEIVIERYKKNPKLFIKNHLHHCVRLNTCLIPQTNGVQYRYFSISTKKLWDKFYTNAPRLRSASEKKYKTLKRVG